MAPYLIVHFGTSTSCPFAEQAITLVNPYLGNSIQSGFPTTERLEASLGCIMAHVVIWKILCTPLIIDSKGAVRLLSVKHILLICRVNLKSKIFAE